ncbi:MAG: hypothetical protein VW868_00770 [Bacteroidota bacterium]
MLGFKIDIFWVWLGDVLELGLYAGLIFVVFMMFKLWYDASKISA